MEYRGRRGLLALVVVVGLIGCDTNVTPTAAPTPAATATVLASATPTATLPRATPTQPAPPATASPAPAIGTPTLPAVPATASPGPSATAAAEAPSTPGGGQVPTATEAPVGATTRPGTPPPTPAAVVGCPAAPAARRDGIGDPYFPQLGNSGYDALHYALDLSVTVASNTISGTATIDARATADLPGFNLDFQGLTISSVAVDDAPARYSRTAHELAITPTHALAAGTPFTVRVAYHGVPQTAIEANAQYSGGWTHYDGGIYVASEPVGASNWYPVNDHPCDKASYSFRVTVPKPYVAATNGLLQNTIDNGATRTYVWVTAYPVASYLVAMNIADFTVDQARGPQGLPIRSYFPRTLAAALTPKVARLPDMIALFEQRFGPYPFEAYGIAVANTDLHFALETQTLSLFGKDVAVTRAGPEEVLAHELAHQWFGDSVSLARWQDIWLNEGFATYAQWLWLEQSEGRAAFEDRIAQMHSVVAQQKWPPPGKPPADDLFNDGVYLRGGLTLHALRQTVGDDTFFRILQTYVARFRYGNADTADFIAIADQVSGQKLDDLFDAWLYQPAEPPLP